MGKRVGSAWLLPTLSALCSLLVTLPAFGLMGWLDTYMDEEFHIPQAQAYCRGEFRRWDPKITTLPGLYLASSAVRAPMLILLDAVGWGSRSSSGGGEALCGAAELRAINLAFGAGTAAVSACILGRLFPAASPHTVLLRSMTVLLFPLHFFYIGMYYTDPACLFAVLFMYERILARDTVGSAIMGAVSVVMRQTSIVWVVFCAGVAVLRVVEADMDGGQGGREKGQSSSISWNGGDKSRTNKKTDEPCMGDENLDAGIGSSSVPHHDADVGLVLSELISRALTALKLASGRLFAPSMAQCWPHALVVACFAAFVRYNGGVAVGDKEQHKAMLHLPQPLYFSAFCAASLAPHLVQPQVLITSFPRWCIKSSLPAVLFLAAATLCVHFATFAHPYLLADNRHYTFYLWRKTIGLHAAVKYAFTPGYLLSVWSISRSLRRTLSSLSVLLFWVCTVMVLVPSGLLEFRYFSVPTVLVLLHIPPPKGTFAWASEYFTLAGFALVNAATFYMYVARPFAWQDGSVARFMW